MSIENKNTEIASQFPATYPMPEDPRAYEEELTATIKSDFPDASWMLEHDLKELEKYAGTPGSGSLALRIPSPEETAGSAPYVAKGNGELPLETVAVLGGLYALTGAEIVGESTEENTHQVIRKGQYNGWPVYFREARSAYDDGNATFEVSATHEDNVLSAEALFAKRNPLLGAVLDTFDPVDKPKYK